MHPRALQPPEIPRKASSEMDKEAGRETAQAASAAALSSVPPATFPAGTMQSKTDSSAIAAEIATLRKSFAIARSSQVCIPSEQAL